MAGPIYLVADSQGNLWYRSNGTWVMLSGGGGGVTQHSLLAGLNADDHPQYHNDQRADARYSALGHGHDASEVTSGTFDDARISSEIARDSEVASAVSDGQAAAEATAAAALSAHEAAANPHPSYLTQAEGDGLYHPLATDLATQAELDTAVSTHEAAANPHPTYLTQTEADALYEAVGSGGGGGVTLADVYPVGSVYVSVVSTNPGTVFGFGTWQKIAGGRVLVGQTDGDPDFDTPEETGGAKTVTLTEAQIPAHTHVQNAHTHVQIAHSHLQQRYPTATGSLTGFTVDTSMSGTPAAANATESVTAVNQNATAVNQNTGGGGAHNNMPPFFVVYFWERTA